MPNMIDIINAAEGQYAIAGTTGGLTAGAATKLIYYARNTSTTKLALIRRVTIDGVYATTAFAVGAVLYQLHVARAFTAENGTPGGTALTITGNSQNLRTNMPAIALGVIRISTTAVLGAPTWTLDANPVGQLNSHSSAGVGVATPIVGNQYVPNNGVLFDASEDSAKHPIILGADEGIAVQVTVPATGVWIAGIGMVWAESNPF